VLQDGENVKAVLLYATKAEFRHGYQRWFRVLGLKIVPVGAKMIYIIERILLDFSTDDCISYRWLENIKNCFCIGLSNPVGTRK